jgi:predicted ester cyclase
MPVDQRDKWVRAYLEDVFNGHNLQSLDKYMTENLVSHWLGDRSLHGREAWREGMAKFFDAFPDAAYTLDDLFCTGDKGVWRGTWVATQRKEWEGIPAKPPSWPFSAHMCSALAHVPLRPIADIGPTSDEHSSARQDNSDLGELARLRIDFD